jgi:hypothetical protein
METTIRMVEVAVSDGSSSNLTDSQIFFGSVVVRGPPRKSVSTTSSKEVRTAKAPAYAGSGRSSGTRRRCRAFPAADA